MVKNSRLAAIGVNLFLLLDDGVGAEEATLEHCFGRCVLHLFKVCQLVSHCHSVTLFLLPFAVLFLERLEEVGHAHLALHVTALIVRCKYIVTFT